MRSTIPGTSTESAPGAVLCCCLDFWRSQISWHGDNRGLSCGLLGSDLKEWTVVKADQRLEDSCAVGVEADERVADLAEWLLRGTVALGWSGAGMMGIGGQLGREISFCRTAFSTALSRR